MERFRDIADGEVPIGSAKPSQKKSFFSLEGDVSQPIVYPIQYQHTQIHEVSSQWLAGQRILNETSANEIVAAYKLLRTQVIKKLKSNGWNSVGIISARSNQGATLTAINLAISIAMDYQHTALLVDFNLRTPSIHSYFNFHPHTGLSDYILHGDAIGEMLFTPNIESLVVLPGREVILDSSERLTSPQVRQLVGEIKARYASRVILFDLPPLLDADDTVAFLEQFDAGLLVIEEGVTTKEDIQKMSELLDDKPILGTVFNNIKR